MAKTDSIPAFPPDIDRDAFGHWLSGFIDGEGCFYLACPYEPKTDSYRPRAQFIVTLRADDYPVLCLIWSFLGCGRAYITHKKTIRNPNDVAIYYSSTVRDLEGVVIPHFERYPLRAKKAKDFLVFKDAVALMAAVNRRDRKGIRVGTPGQPWRWREGEKDIFRSFVAAMREARAYVSPVTRLPLI